jgi:hypothetical protein
MRERYMAIPPGKIAANCCYSGEGNMDRLVVSVEGDRVQFKTRTAGTLEPWGAPRTQILRAFARLVHDQIDCGSGGTQ